MKAKPKIFTEDQLKAFVIKLRKKQRAIEDRRNFCMEHNFTFEQQALNNEANQVSKIVHEMENEFDLGFVWDSSLN